MGGPLQDTIFLDRVVGPFADASTFNEFFTQPSWKENRLNPSPYGHDPLRQGVPDGPIRFVHGDLNQKNILVTPEGVEPPRVLAVVDWHQSGWYPAYWEYCKARWTAKVGGEWATNALPRFLESSEEIYTSFNYYCLCHGV